MSFFKFDPPPINLLVADDDALALGSLASILTSRYPTMRLHTVENGGDGLALFARVGFDIVISDIRMPIMDGVQMSREMKSLDSEVKIILLTAYENLASLEQCVDIGINKFLKKPLDVRKLFAAVDCCIADINQKRLNRETLNIFSAVINGTTDQVYVKDPGGRYLLCNEAACDAIGKPPEEILGRDDAALFPREHAQAVLREDRELLASGGTLTYQQSYTGPDGVERTFLATKGPLLDDRGNLAGILATARDITERIGLEQAILQLNESLEQRVTERTAQFEAVIRELEAFCYTISHDLRSPLRHINCYLNILVEECGVSVPPEGRAYLDRACAASVTMSRLIDELLELSRVSRYAVVKERVNLSELGHEISLGLREAEPDRKVEFVIDRDLEVKGDRMLLKLALKNLLENAWKYSSRKESARIELGKKAIDQQEVFFVKDNGVGFDKAYMDKLFGVFQRLHGAEYEGSGIGLATVKRITERHGGRIWADAGVDEGATFYFVL